MNKNLLTGGAILAVVGVVLGAVLFPVRERTIEKVIEQRFGALSSPEISSPYIDLSGNTFYSISGTCDDKSPTMWNIANPVAATSTIVRHTVTGQNGTTTITLESGTTSITTLLGGSVPQPAFINAIGVGTSSAFFIEAGTPANALIALGGNATSSGASTYRQVTIGPNDRLYGRATSTTQNQAASGDDTLEGLTNTNNQFSCTYEYLLMY